MSGGLRYLALRSARNRLRQFVTQLRKPAYLLAVVLGVGYLVMLVRAPRSQAGNFGQSATETVGALGILVLAASAWIFGTGRSLLECTGPERTLLFPAPVPASRILDFRLLALQLPVWRNVLLWTLLSGAGLGVAMLVQHGVALWILLTTLQWHRLASARIRAGDDGSGNRGRAARILGLLLLASVPFMMSGSLGQGAAGLKVILEGLTTSPWLRVLLWPFAIPLRPFTASSTTSFAAALPGALLLLAVHYVWLRHLGVDTGTAHTAEGLSARGEPLWRLGPAGTAASAFFWKNFTALLRGPTAIIATGGALLIVATPSILRGAGRESAAAVVGWMTLVWGIILIVVGPQFIRNDLRRDQRQLELLRALPVRGFDVLLGSAAAAAGALSLAVSSLLFAGLLGTRGSPELPIPEALLSQALVGGFLVVVPLCLAGILIQDGALLLFPAWSRLTARRGSPTALGANIANSALTLVLLGLLLVVPMGAGLAASGGVDAPWAPVRLGLAAGLLLGIECWMLLRWLGSRFDVLQPIRTTG